LYLGNILRIGKQKTYQIFSEMKQRDAEYLFVRLERKKRLNPAEDTKAKRAR
jgi:hypothetical protein